MEKENLKKDKKKIRNMKKIDLKHILQLQLIIVIYTVAGIMAKLASLGEHFWWIITFFFLDIFLLGIYAIFWQQLIKIFPLSVAYANRAMSLLWSAVWARIIFGEQITGKQWAAIGLVIVGTILVNGGDKHE